MNPMENALHKGFGSQIRQVNEEEKSIVHVVSDSTIDRSGEIVDPGGMNAKNFEKNPVVLFGHNYGGAWLTGSSPNIPIIGRSAWIKRGEGETVISKTIFADLTEISRDAWALAKAGFLPATSIGFMPDKSESMKLVDLKDLNPQNRSEFDSKMDILIWRKWELYEYSLVPVPANPNALERDGIGKALDLVKNDYTRGMLHSALNEKRLCELEECSKSMEEKVKEMVERILSESPHLVNKTIDATMKTIENDAPGNVVQTLEGEDLTKFLRSALDGAFRRAQGKIN